jgi:hypothetical protein
VTDQTPPEDAAPSAEEPIAPLPVPMRRIVEIGMLVWLVALVVTLVVPSLHEGDRYWWPQVCIAGLGLGAIGWLYLWRGRGNAKDAG